MVAIGEEVWTCRRAVWNGYLNDDRKVTKKSNLYAKMLLQTVPEKMTEKFFGIVLTFLHLIISAFNVVKGGWLSLRRNYKQKYFAKSTQKECEFVAAQAKGLKKIPSHLVVILGNEVVSYRDLANLTLWCLAAGISFISFYDHNGMLKKNEVELYKELTEMTKGYTGNIKWGRKTETGAAKQKNGLKNGVSSSLSICVNILSLDDGKGALVDLARSLSQSVVSGQLKSRDITQDLVDEKLQEDLGTPDPELALYCGDICSMFGFLPWQIRVTEFLQLKTHHSVRATEFVSLLHRYGKCIQRLGK